MISSRLIPIVIIIGAIGLFIGYTQPTYSNEVTEIRAEIRDLDTALKAAKQFKEKELQLTQERSSIAPEQLARLESFLPDSVDNVQLIVDMNSLAARSGMQLSDFDIVGGKQDDTATAQQPGNAIAPQQMPTAPGFVLGPAETTESLELSVSAIGSYAAFRTFLDGIEKSLRPLDIVELSVQDSATGIYTYDITFRLYWLR